MPRHPSTDIALATLAAASFAGPAAAQSLEGSTFTYEVLGDGLNTTTGTAAVGPGVEFTVTDIFNAIEWAVDVDATGVTITPTFDNPASGAINWGIGSGVSLGAVRLSGLDFGGPFEITEAVLSGTAGAGDSDITTTADSVQIGATSGPNNVLSWEPGEVLRLDFTTELPCPWVFNETAGTYHASLADAVVNSAQGDTLELGPCVFEETDFDLRNDNLIIRGQGVDETFIDDSTFPGGEAVFDHRSGDQSTISGLTIRNADTAEQNGAAVLVASDGVTYRNVRFENNGSSTRPAGTFEVQGGTLHLDACEMIGSDIGHSSDIVVFNGGVLSATNTLFVRSGSGGQIARIVGSNDVAAFTNCTFAHEFGGRSLNVQDAGTDVSAVNCVFAPGQAASGDVTMIRSVFAGATGDNVDGEPVFVDAAARDYRLAAGSPGVDAGDYDRYVAAGGTIGDLLGVFRVYDDPNSANFNAAMPAIDAGAYETVAAAEPTAVECPADIAAPAGVLNVDDIDAFVQSFLSGCP